MAKKKSTDETAPTPAAGEETKKPAAKKKAAAPKAEAPAGDAAPAKAAAKAPAAKSAPASKKPAKPQTGTGGFGFGIDTNLAAQNAARMLLNRSSAPALGGTVKHLKDSLNKSQNAGLGNLLGGNTGTAGKSAGQSHFSNQQKGHNQATGHVGNTGVPRRTPG
jgi:hypothetical protein